MLTSDVLVRYGVAALVAVMLLKRVFTKIIAKRKLPGLLNNGAAVVDVRSPAEFAAGHAAGSLNIPFKDLQQGTRRLDPERWIIVCCASGARSAVARRWLLKHGFPRVLNGGSWRNLP